VLRADIIEAGAQTQEATDGGRIGSLYERMKQARSAMSDPTDAGGSIAERERELLRRELEYERAKKALDDEIVKQAKDATSRELERFFGGVDEFSKTVREAAGERADLTRRRDEMMSNPQRDTLAFSRNQYESVGGQVGGAAMKNVTGVADQQLKELREINASIRENTRALAETARAIAELEGGGVAE
jgi:hypothetical protein